METTDCATVLVAKTTTGSIGNYMRNITRKQLLKNSRRITTIKVVSKNEARTAVCSLESVVPSKGGDPENKIVGQHTFR